MAKNTGMMDLAALMKGGKVILPGMSNG
jgi:hypothetical protein